MRSIEATAERKTAGDRGDGLFRPAASFIVLATMIVALFGVIDGVVRNAERMPAVVENLARSFSDEIPAEKTGPTDAMKESSALERAMTTSGEDAPFSEAAATLAGRIDDVESGASSPCPACGFSVSTMFTRKKTADLDFTGDNDPNGVKGIGPNTGAAMASKTGVVTNARTPSQFMADNHSVCWMCGFTANFIRIVDAIGRDGYSVFLKENLVGLIQGLFIIWLAVQGYKMILGFGPGSQASSIVWDIAKKSALTFVLVMMLQLNTFWTELYELPLGIAMDVAGKFMDAAGTPFGAMVPANAGVSAGIPAAGAGAEAIIAKVADAVNKVETMHFYGVAIGWSIATSPEINLADLLFVDIPKLFKFLIQVLSGLFIVSIFAIGIVHYAFSIMDLFLRMAIICIFAPLAIVAFLLKQTRGFAVSAFMGLLNSWFTLAFSGMAYVFSAAVLSAAPGAFYAPGAMGAGSKGNPAEGMDGVLGILAQPNMFLTPVDAFFWQLVLSGMVITLVMGKTSAMASTLANFQDGGSILADKFKSYAGKLNGMAQTAVTGAVGGAIAGGGGAIASGGINAIGNIAGGGAAK